MIRAGLAAAIALAAALLTGCESGTTAPDRAPDAVGTVTSVEPDGDSVAVGFDPDEGYEYFEGTTFDILEADVLLAAIGATADPSGLAVGDRIEVWAEQCAESFPVQCAVTAARLVD